MSERRPAIFRSFFMGGFECSTHRVRSGKRLDLSSSTRHEEFALEDYRRMARIGLRTARDGIRWHLVERERGRYDWSGPRRMIEAGLEAGIQVVWDLLHFGWPDHVDVFGQDLAARFAEFAHRFAEVVREEGVRDPAMAPVNEVSFLSFAGGQEGFFNPFVHGRGDELKERLVSASTAAGRAVRSSLPGVRLLHTDPVIRVAARPGRPQDAGPAEGHQRAQYHAWDMLAGRVRPELGGGADLLDVLGVNYYIHNQWYYPGGHGSVISPSSAEYRPLRELLLGVWERYRRPLILAETGIEDEARPAWLTYVGAEVRSAMRLGADIQGICLYPIVNHPGWEDDRHCHNGLWDYANDRGERRAYAPLLDTLRREEEQFERMALESTVVEDAGPALRGLDEIARSIAEATETSRES